MSLIGLCMATYLYTSKPTRPMTTEIKGHMIKIEEIRKAIDKANGWIDIEVTYYTNSIRCCGNTKAISANGTDLNKHTASRGGSLDYYIPIACPDNIKFGTKLYIENLGKCICVDRGSAIKWNDEVMKIDVYIPNTTNRELLKLGQWKTKGYIIH